jgi:hypothetical protein
MVFSIIVNELASGYVLKGRWNCGLMAIPVGWVQ